MANQNQSPCKEPSLAQPGSHMDRAVKNRPMYPKLSVLRKLGTTAAIPVSLVNLDWGYPSSTRKISVMPGVTCCPNVHKPSKWSDKGATMDPARSYAGSEVGHSYSQVLQAGIEKNKTQGWN